MHLGEPDWLSEARARDTHGQITLDQMRLALRNIALDHWIMPAFTAILCAMFWRWVPAPRLIGWFAAVVVSLVPLTFVSKAFLRDKPDAEHWRSWVVGVTAAYFASTAVWCSMAYLLWVPHNDLNHMVILLVLACALAGSSALLGASRPMAWASFAAYGSALVLAPLQEGNWLYAGGSLLAVFFVFYLVHMSRQIFETARDMLMLKNDKNDLIVALALSKSESDEARTRAEAASRAKSQFLANMSHELRTPLNAILGFSEIISTSTPGSDDSKNQEYAGLIHESGHHLLALINDVLDLAKIEAGGFELRETELSLDHLIEEAFTLVEPRAREGQCILAKDIAPNLPLVFADERALKQILLNLLSNAVKFTPEGGHVTAFVRVDEDGCIAFGVKDTGVGIAPEDLKRVFQNFGQGRHDVVIADKGTGLGLPIVKGLVDAHGGNVVLESRLSVGTTVTVRLPASRTRPVAMRAAS